MGKKGGRDMGRVGRLLGKPIPRDPNTFRYLSPDRPAVMPKGLKFPSPEEFNRRADADMIAVYERGTSGN